MKFVIKESVEGIREQVGDGRVLCAVSGGVDSAVTARLVHEAVGDRLTCAFVDTGLMREGEPEQVPATFRAHMPGVRLAEWDAARLFLNTLAGVTDPEQKRVCIGAAYVTVLEGLAQIWEASFLALGTNKADVLETEAGIKKQHNVAVTPESLELVEPLRGLFKAEVREVAEALAMPASILRRQPFPGPGLAIRIIGEVTEERLDVVRAADHVFLRELSGYGAQVAQAFAVLLPEVKSTGVVGGRRAYGSTVVLRAVLTEQFMEATAADLSVFFLRKVADRIVGEVPGVGRVVYDVTGKPPATIEWE